MMRRAWLLAILTAAALALLGGSAPIGAAPASADRSPCVEIVLRITLDGDHPLQGTILKHGAGPAGFRVSGLRSDLCHLPAMHVKHRVARGVQVLLRAIRVILEHVADDALRAMRSR